MFVESSFPVALPLADARAALVSALAGDGLVDESSRAYAEGLRGLRQVGAHGLSKRVEVKTLPARTVDETTIMPIRWEATGVAGQLFPALDADLCLTAVNEVTCLLSIVGRYAPPLGGIGQVIDRTVLSGTAQSSVDAFLRELSGTIRKIAMARHRGTASRG